MLIGGTVAEAEIFDTYGHLCASFEDRRLYLPAMMPIVTIAPAPSCTSHESCVESSTVLPR